MTKFIDPISFDSSSLINSGLFDSYKSGNVNICSAQGSGITDDKQFIYSTNYKILIGEPILENVKTWNAIKMMR